MSRSFAGAVLFGCLLLAHSSWAAPDTILFNGKIATVNSNFSVVEAIAIEGGKVLQTGSNAEIQALSGPSTQRRDLRGRFVLPGLIDSHVHPGAAMTEFDHPIPAMETVEDVLEYVRQRASSLQPGQWIHVRQVFITRLREPRYPTRAELDKAAPRNPVHFSTGPDSVLNSLALEQCGFTKDFKVTDGGPGYMETDPSTGEPTGLLRGLGRFVKMNLPGREPSPEDYYNRTLQLFKDYNSVGLTTVSDRNADPAAIARYQKMHEQGDLSIRMALMHSLSTLGPVESVQEKIRQIAKHPLFKEDPHLRIIGVKAFLDGGMLTGSARMREPWGVSEIYGIKDPEYRGVLNIPREKLKPMVQTAFDQQLQFTAHSVGDGAVHLLLGVYEELSSKYDLRQIRPSVTHCNFMSAEAIAQAAKIGAVLDIQPIWLYMDARTLEKQFGYERLRYFQPLRSLFKAGAVAGGGSDHMQKIGSMRAINPYNPFLGIWITLTRQARWLDHPLHPEEALTREQAIRFYTSNNAYLLKWEDEIGSLEPGKRADLIIVDRDLLSCPVDSIPDTQVLATFLNGKPVFTAPQFQP